MPNTPYITPVHSHDYTPAAFLIAAFLTGIGTALQTPTLSLFLSRQVHASAQMVGIFFTASAIIGIGISQLLASRSDRQGDRKRLIILCCLCGMAGCLLFAWSRNYWLLLLVGITLNSFGNTSNPQLFALAREYADQTNRQAVMFTAIMRAQISLAWVVGPPLAYALATGFGFTTMYLGTVITFCICGLIVWLFLPTVVKVPQNVSHTLQAPRHNRRDTLLLFIICTMMLSANSLYLISMPLYITSQLHLPDKLAGLMMGTAAGLEIPVMLVAGYYASRIGNRLLLRIAAISALLFYLLLLFVHSMTGLLTLQVLNAIFIGIVAGIGMTYFQQLMPGQAGTATTLYANTSSAGWILAGLLASIIGGYFSYHTVFYFSFLLVVIAGVCLWRIREAPRQQSVN